MNWVGSLSYPRARFGKTVKWYLENENWLKRLQTRKGVGERLGTRYDFSFGKTGQVATELQVFEEVMALGRDQSGCLTHKHALRLLNHFYLEL